MIIKTKSSPSRVVGLKSVSAFIGSQKDRLRRERVFPHYVQGDHERAHQFGSVVPGVPTRGANRKSYDGRKCRWFATVGAYFICHERAPQYGRAG